MNRELKFRYWDEKLKHFVYSDEYKWESKNEALSVFFHYAANYAFEGRVYQFTGLKDKNGKEIYEGDIVKISADFWKEYSTPATVMFGDYNCCYGEGYAYDIEYGFFLYDNVGRTFSLRDEKFIYEIIGNAFETPDLLK